MRMNQSHKDQGKNIPDAKNKCEGLNGTKLGRYGAVQTVTGSSLRAICGLCVDPQGSKSGKAISYLKHLSEESWGQGAALLKSLYPSRCKARHRQWGAGF